MRRLVLGCLLAAAAALTAGCGSSSGSSGSPSSAAGTAGSSPAAASSSGTSVGGGGSAGGAHTTGCRESDSQLAAVSAATAKAITATGHPISADQVRDALAAAVPKGRTNFDCTAEAQKIVDVYKISVPS